MSWFVKVEGRVYGPYTPPQMKAFVSEGRIAAHSQVSNARDEGWCAASDVDEFTDWLAENAGGPAPEKRVTAGVRPANFVIVTEIQSEAGPEFRNALTAYGELEQITPGTWLLRGPTTAAVLRNELSHILDRDDRLLIIDATHDRAAWFNLGRDADENIRNLWGRAN
ncbi:DUF4339 domain-containing protein [Maricaulis sp.]|uniref:DUF4339 domain-containing protein n=1 Tax=Maricaulis sp. TaxID=1486257 RepID=UPI003A8CFA0C|tara:strand:+ start:1269 stop:1769 length:501 start_codon:yes stop_codon:yes gene_type:complete